jgi:chromosome segregation ATPase
MSKPRAAWVIVPVLIGSLALAAALFILQRRSVESAGQSERLKRLEQENLELRAREAQFQQQMQALQQQIGVESSELGDLASRGSHRSQVPAGTLEAIRMLGQLKENLVSANAAAEQLRTRVAELEGEMERVKDENRTLDTRQSELAEKLHGANSVVDALQAELKGKNDRVVPLQMANKQLREENQAANEKISRVTQSISQLEDINRRRDAYLTSILRRYRDVTDQYRALAARLENPGEGSAPAGTELSRIQSTISMAEDDLRQLNSLNAQADRLLRQIRGR